MMRSVYYYFKVYQYLFFRFSSFFFTILRGSYNKGTDAVRLNFFLRYTLLFTFHDFVGLLKALN